METTILPANINDSSLHQEFSPDLSASNKKSDISTLEDEVEGKISRENIWIENGVPKTLCRDNKAYTHDPDDTCPPSNRGTINEDRRPPNDVEDNWKMGCYRQLARQYGLSFSPLVRLSSALYLVVPLLLIAPLLAPTVPSPFLPCIAWIFGRLGYQFAFPPPATYILMGVAVRAAGFFHCDPFWVQVFTMVRYLSVATVLVRSGLGLVHLPALHLAILPSSMEAVAVALSSHYLLGFPWLWALVFGAAISTASSSVNAEKLTQLKASGYGREEFYQMIQSSSTVENIYAITAFTVFLTYIFTEEDLWSRLVHGPGAILAGVVFACTWGALSSLFPHKDDEWLVAKRCGGLCLGGTVAYLGFKRIGLSPGGPLATLAIGTLATFFWRAQGWPQSHPGVVFFVELWSVMEAALLSLLGAEVDLWSTSLPEVLYAAGILIFCILVRITSCAVCLAARRELNWKEVTLVLLVWLPKATVLAALSPQVMDALRMHTSPEDLQTDQRSDMARLISLTSSLGVLLTVPLSHLLVRLAGHTLLPKPKLSTIKEISRLAANPEPEFKL